MSGMVEVGHMRGEGEGRDGKSEFYDNFECRHGVGGN
jgi:hypothetical protein